MPIRRRKARTRLGSNRKKSLARNKQTLSKSPTLCPSCGELSVESCKCGVTDDDVSDTQNEASKPKSEDDDAAIPTRRFSSGRKCTGGSAKSAARAIDHKRVNEVKLAEGDGENESHVRTRGNIRDNATNARAIAGSNKSESYSICVSPTDRRTRQSLKLSFGAQPKVMISPIKTTTNTRSVKNVNNVVITSSDGSDEEENDLVPTRSQGALNVGANFESRSNVTQIPHVSRYPCLSHDLKVLVERATLPIPPRIKSCDTGPSDDRCSTSGTEGFESVAPQPCLRRSSRIRSTSSEESLSRRSSPASIVEKANFRSRVKYSGGKDLCERTTDPSPPKSIHNHLTYQRIVSLPRSSSEENFEFDDLTEENVGVAHQSSIINRLGTSDSDSYEGILHPRIKGRAPSRVKKVGKARIRRIKSNSALAKSCVAKDSPICNGKSKTASCNYSDVEYEDSLLGRPCIENGASTSSTFTQTCTELSYSVLSAWYIEESTKKSIGVQNEVEMHNQTTQTDNFFESGKALNLVPLPMCGSGTKLSDLMLSCVEQLKSEFDLRNKNVRTDKESEVHSNVRCKILQEAQVSSGASKREKLSVHKERPSHRLGKHNNKDGKESKTLQNNSPFRESGLNVANEPKQVTTDTQDKVGKRKSKAPTEKPRSQSISDENVSKTLSHSICFDVVSDVDSSCRSSSTKESNAVESGGNNTSKKSSNLVPKSTSMKKETKVNSNISAADNTAPVSKRRKSSSSSKSDKGEKLCLDNFQSQSVRKSHTEGKIGVKSASKSWSARDSSKQNEAISCANSRNKNREKLCDKSTSRKKNSSSSSVESESRTFNQPEDKGKGRVAKSFKPTETISSFPSCSRHSVLDECAEKNKSPSRFPTTVDTLLDDKLPNLEPSEINGDLSKECSKESDRFPIDLNVVNCAKTNPVHSTDTMLESERLPSVESDSGGIDSEAVSELLQPSIGCDGEAKVIIKTEVVEISYDDDNDDIISIYPDSDYDHFLDDMSDSAVVESGDCGIKTESPYFSASEVHGSEKESQNAEIGSSVLPVLVDHQDPPEITSGTQVVSSWNGLENCWKVPETEGAECSSIEPCEYNVDCGIVDYPESCSEETTGTNDSDFELGDVLNTDEENNPENEHDQDLLKYITSKVNSEEQNIIRQRISVMTPPFGSQSSHSFNVLNEDVVEDDGGVVKDIHTLDLSSMPMEHLRADENLNTNKMPTGAYEGGSLPRTLRQPSQELPSCLLVPALGVGNFKIKLSPIFSEMCFILLTKGSCNCRKYRHKFDKDICFYADLNMDSWEIFMHIRFSVKRKLKSFLIGQGVELAEILAKRKEGAYFSDVLRLYCQIGLPMHRWKLLLQCIEKCGNCDEIHVKNVLKFLVSNYLHCDIGIEPLVYDEMIDLITSISCEFHSTNSLWEVLVVVLSGKYWFSGVTLEKMLRRCVQEPPGRRSQKLSFAIGKIVGNLNAKFDPNSSLGKVLKEFVGILLDHGHSIVSEKIEKMIDSRNLSNSPFSLKDPNLKVDPRVAQRDQGVHSIPVVKNPSHLKRNSSLLVDVDTPPSKKSMLSINQRFSDLPDNCLPNASLKDTMNPYSLLLNASESTASTSEYFTSISPAPSLPLHSLMDDLPKPAQYLHNLGVSENHPCPGNEEVNDNVFPIPTVVSRHSPTPSASRPHFSRKRSSRTLKSSDSCITVLPAITTEKRERSLVTGQTLSQVPIVTDDIVTKSSPGSFEQGLALNRTSTPLLTSPGPNSINDLQVGSSSSENIGNLEVVDQSLTSLFNPNVHAERKCSQPYALRGIDGNVSTIHSSSSPSSGMQEETCVPVEVSTLEEAIRRMDWTTPVLSKHFVPHLTAISFNKDMAVKLVDLFAESLPMSISSLRALVTCMESTSFSSMISTSFYNQMKRLISTVIFNLVLKMVMIDCWTEAYELLDIANAAKLPVISSEAFIDEEISMSRKILVLCEVCFRAQKMQEAIDYLKLGNLFGRTPEDWMYDSMEGDAEVQVILLSNLISKLAAGAYCSLAPSVYLEIYRSQLSIKEPVDLTSHVNKVIICALNGSLVNSAYEIYCTLDDKLNGLPKVTYRAMLCGMVKAKDIPLAREFYSAISSLQIYPSIQGSEGPFEVEVQSYLLLEEIFVVIDHALEYLQDMLDRDPKKNQDPNFVVNIIVKESDPPEELCVELIAPDDQGQQDLIPNCLACQTYSLGLAIEDIEFVLRSIMTPSLSYICVPVSEGISRITLKKSTLVNHLISRSFYEKGYNDNF